MRYLGAFIAVSCLTGIAAAVSCASNTQAPGTGGGEATSSHSSSSSSSSASGTGGGANGTGGMGGMGAGAGGGPTLDCTIPTKPPSMGACVGFTTDAGTELDAGDDDAGNASRTTCNPVTNQGCTGTDTCNPDNSDKFYTCQKVGTMPNVAVCGDCTAAQAFCAAGGLCVGVSSTSNQAVCIQMCCTDADCGTASAKCMTTGFLTMDLPMGVGLCINP